MSVGSGCANELQPLPQSPPCLSPPLRSVPGYGEVTIRLVADNPGVWMLHW